MFLTTQVSSTRHDTTRDRGNEKTWTSPRWLRTIRFRTESSRFGEKYSLVFRLENFDDSNGKWTRLDRRAIWLLDVSYRHVGAWNECICFLPSLSFQDLYRICGCSGSFTRSESRSIYSPLAWAARRSLSCCWPVVNSTQLTLTLNLAPVLCLCSDIPRNSQAIAQGIAPRVCPASGVPSIVWDFPAKG